MGENTNNVSGSAEAKSSIQVKDFFIPISIIMAGALMGAGLYFGGGAPAGSDTPTQVVDNQPQQNGDIEAINPVDENDHIKGSLDAKIKIVEYSDFDCPYCSRFHDVMNSIVEKHAGEVAWIYRQFPLEQLHPQAPAVALASECVADIGGNDAFWKFTDSYFATRGAGDKTAHDVLVPKLVTEAGVAQADFTDCFNGQKFAQEVQDDMSNAFETGGRGTPWSILIGPSGKKYPINGALPESAVEQLIQVALQEA